ncbi:hypothetical protein [Crocosphaera chwakensis]|uniref:Uncharacterized protein n=1 Tax=Crocosphaera chwakensis CCY0110 TaxID=391612 RepID=A3IWS6_9CHRO|nr:hypothetical protein [Crocosphaera chwakensis]EAZ89081.1 hypothetical protein CY0110_08721 [Crocosphaera chwakensis CCY0110]
MKHHQIRNALDLYLPTSSEIDMDEINRYIEGQQAIDRFLNLELTPNELTEFLGDVSRVDVYDWLDCCENNLSYLM